MKQRHKILLVEDDEMNAKLLRDFLTFKGHEVTHITNGLEVLSKVESTTPDIILMDIQIFGKSGIDCTKELRAIEKYKKLPIFAVSAFSKDKILKADEMMLFDEYIEKPVMFSEFFSLLEAHLQISKDAK